jgi:bloom syndrome protein
MLEQREKYSTKGICCEFVGELQQDIEVITSIQKGHAQLLFVSPESLLLNPQWRDMLLLPVYQKKVVALIVDEAHCIAMWHVSSKCEHPYIESSRLAPQALQVPSVRPKAESPRVCTHAH